MGSVFGFLFRRAEKDGPRRGMGAVPAGGGRKDGADPLCESQGIPAGGIHGGPLSCREKLCRKADDVRHHLLDGRTSALSHFCPASGLEDLQELREAAAIPHPGNVLPGRVPDDPRLWQGAVPGHAGIQDQKRTAAGQDLQRCRGLPGDCRRVPSSGRCGEFSVDPGESLWRQLLPAVPGTAIIRIIPGTKTSWLWSILSPQIWRPVPAWPPSTSRRSGRLRKKGRV